MKKIKETITALTSGDFPGAVRINRKESIPIPDGRLDLIMKYSIKIIGIAAGTVLILNAGIWKLLALMGFGIFFGLIYFGLKD